MKKILNIPYYSQHRDIKDKYWKSRACGAVCLNMVLRYLQSGDKKSQTLPMTVGDFVMLANKKGAYGEYGWIHQGLVDIAKGFGVKLKRKEYKENIKTPPFCGSETSLKLKEGIIDIISSLENNKPVLVSSIKKWSEEKKYHMVVLTGFKMNEKGEVKGFYYNDTDYQNENEGKNLFVGIEIFKKYWRRLAIFCE